MSNLLSGADSIFFALLFIFGALGYFVYGGTNGTMAMVILWILFFITLLLAIMPVIGFIAQGLAMYCLFPWVAELTGIGDSWLTGLMFLVSILWGFVITSVTTFSVIKTNRIYSIGL